MIYVDELAVHSVLLDAWTKCVGTPTDTDVERCGQRQTFFHNLLWKKTALCGDVYTRGGVGSDEGSACCKLLR